jgi:hypothetical protein
MGEDPKQPFQLSFNGTLKIDFQGSRVTSDGGLILVRELDGPASLNSTPEGVAVQRSERPAAEAAVAALPKTRSSCRPRSCT